MSKEKIIYITFAIIFGISIGNYIYSLHNKEIIQTLKSDNENIYLLQYGVYHDENNMINNTKKLRNYFFF